jgi:transient receptor potential cation channel subfamily A protein 1
VRFLTILIALLNSVNWVLFTFSLGLNALNLIRNAFVWADSLAILFTIIYLLPVHGLDSAVWEIGSLASFFCWFGLTHKLRPFDVFGVYVTMFMTITRSVFLVLTICFLLIAAFSLSLYVLLGNIPIFSTVGFSFFTNFGHMLGEIDYTLPILEDKEGNLKYEKLTFVFVIFIAILM